MKITYSKGRGTKIHISIDGEYRLTTDADFWFSCGYRSGDEITPEQFKELSEAICYRKAFNKAVDYLSRRDHSVRELTDKLGRSFEYWVCDRVVNDLTERGYLDDTNFARNYARYLCESKHFWTARIKNELYKKGIDRVIIDDVISEISEQGEPTESIIELLKTKSTLKFETQKELGRTVNTLMRMGYTYSQIKSALEIFKDNYLDE